MFGYIFDAHSDTGPVASVNINELSVSKEDLMWYLDIAKELAEKIANKTRGGIDAKNILEGLSDKEEAIVKTVIKNKSLRFEGPAKLERLEDIIAYYIETVAKRFENEHKTLPKDIIFFINNILSVARLAQEELIDTHILYLSS